MVQTFFEHSSQLMGVVKLSKGTIVHLEANPAALRFFAAKNSNCDNLVLPEEIAKLWLAQFQECYEKGENRKFRCQTPESLNKASCILEVEVRCIGVEPSLKEQTFGYVAEDVSERELLLSALESERERFRLAVEGANAGLWDWNVSTNEVYFSPQWKKMLGYEDFEIPSNFLAWENLVHPEDRERALGTIQSYFDNKIDHYRLEHRLRTKSGPYRWILAQGACIRERGGKPLRMTGWHIDIHDLRSALEELKRQEDVIKQQQMKIVASAKMSSLGEMAGGIAHEINNPLAIIHLATHQLRQNISNPSQKELGALDRIERTVDRIVRIVKGLKNFSRSGEKDPMGEVSLEKVLNETLDFCRERFLSHGVRIEVQLDTALIVKGRSVQLSQVFLNLLNNSFDAVSKGSNPWVRVSSLKTENRIGLRFTDSGTGIPVSHLSRIFEPFFSTKEVGEGTGLGLSISKGIVEAHGGTLLYETDGGHTSFIVQFPLASPSP